MYFTITAQPVHEDGSKGFKDRPPLVEHGISLTETMMLMANTMLDHLDVAKWNISIDVDDPQPASQAPQRGRGPTTEDESGYFDARYSRITERGVVGQDLLKDVTDNG